MKLFVDVEMECLATWKEGSTQYLVARLNGTGMQNDEGRYRCFAYAKSGNSTWNLSQSGDASCNGLTSATDGAKIFKMIQSKCQFICFFNSLIWFVVAYLKFSRARKYYYDTTIFTASVKFHVYLRHFLRVTF